MAAAERSEGCRNCTTDRYPILARGLCTRCYRLTLRIEALEKGDLRPLQSLRHARHPAHPEIQKLRRGFVRQYRNRLDFLRIREQQRRGVGLDTLTIEHLLRNLGRRSGARGNPHCGVATRIRHNFEASERIALFQLLHDIEERIPWRPTSTGR